MVSQCGLKRLYKGYRRHYQCLSQVISEEIPLKALAQSMCVQEEVFFFFFSKSKTRLLI